MKLRQAAITALHGAWRYVLRYLAQAPTFSVALPPLLLLSLVLFTRYPGTNYIFDEQEALLANPYVNAVDGLRFVDVIHRDFWGLPPDRSIGSYRPIPNALWRILWQLTDAPFFHAFINVIIHGINAALVASIVVHVSKQARIGWMAGAIFVTSAVLTEAVAGIVGIADVLAGLGILLALRALALPMGWMPFAVFGALLFGLFSKESAMVGVGLIPLAALFLGPMLRDERPLRLVRATFAFVAAALAFVLYVELRRRWFPAPLSAELTVSPALDATTATKLRHAFLTWYAAAPLPHDPVNNPLIDADVPHRVSGALRVFARGLGQVLFPWSLSGDYSAPQEPVPETLVTPVAGLGAAAFIACPALGLLLWARSLWLEARVGRAPWVRSPRSGPLVLTALGLVWFVIAYFPHSNIPLLLPTVRAERFWYVPVIGTTFVLAAFFERWVESGSRIGRGVFAAFLLFQAGRSYAHTMDYRDDLAFWDSARTFSSRSAKAHMNYSVMIGARGDLEGRLVSSNVAIELAPKWPMAHIYTGDTLCRLNRPAEAWQHYRRGFEIGPGELNLIALALQCLYDKGTLLSHEAELRALAAAHPGSWLSYLAIDTLDNHEEHSGVDPQYRPRGYNQRAKEKETASTEDSAFAEPGLCLHPLSGFCDTQPCPKQEEAVRKAAEACSPGETVSFQQCGEVALLIRSTLAGGSTTAFDAGGEMIARSEWTTGDPAFCEGTSLSKTFGILPGCANAEDVRDLCPGAKR